MIGDSISTAPARPDPTGRALGSPCGAYLLGKLYPSTVTWVMTAWEPGSGSTRKASSMSTTRIPPAGTVTTGPSTAAKRSRSVRSL